MLDSTVVCRRALGCDGGGVKHGSHSLFPPPGRRGGQTLSTVGALSAFAFCLSNNETTEHRHISGAVYLVGSRRLMNYAIA